MGAEEVLSSVREKGARTHKKRGFTTRQSRQSCAKWGEAMRGKRGEARAIKERGKQRSRIHKSEKDCRLWT